MRITNNMTTKGYLKNLNSSLKELNASNERMAAKRKYMSIYEDPSRAVKAMQIRKNLNRISIYSDNLEDAQGVLTQYETVISTIEDITTESIAQIMQGINGTSGDAVMKTVANTLRGFQKSILSAANTRFAGDYIFSGANSDVIPFTVSDTGELLYKGENVDTGTFSEEYRYIDIGIGLVTDGAGEVVPSSALNVANSGVELLGSGVDSDGISNNLYNLLGQIADKLESGDVSNIQSYIDKLQAKSDDIRFQYVSVGEKSNFIKYVQERIITEEDNSNERQAELESLDYAEGVIEFYDLQVSYNACLQMGTKILQPSLLDFLN